MLAAVSFLNNENHEITYKKMKDQFLDLLAKTEKKCLKLCEKKYNQERNINVAYHHGIESDYIKIEVSKKKVIAEVNSIEECYQAPLKRIKSLISYAKGLSQSNFNLLFMTILSGELTKHWLSYLNKNYKQFMGEGKEEIPVTRMKFN